MARWPCLPLRLYYRCLELALPFTVSDFHDLVRFVERQERAVRRADLLAKEGVATIPVVAGARVTPDTNSMLAPCGSGR